MALHGATLKLKRKTKDPRYFGLYVDYYILIVLTTKTKVDSVI